MSLKISTENYDYFKLLFKILSNELYRDIPGFNEESNPINYINKLEKRNKSQARNSLKIGLNDIFSDLSDLSSDKLFLIDRVLLKFNYPKSSKLLNEYKNSIAKL